MNIHHLELFYYVAKYEGISEAVRRMPYGIQQPAISGQIIQLEGFLGVTLFQRRPFKLMPAGERLYEFIEPFFSNLDTMAAELQGGTARQIRIGASEVVLRDHLPEILQNLRPRFPGLKIALRSGYQADLETMLQKQEIDLAVTLIETKSSVGISTQALLELPLILLVEKTSKFKSADELWKRDRIEEPLICLPPAEGICRHFQQGLGRLGIDWFPGVEASSLELIETYVANGFGIGLSVALPNRKLPPKVRALPLESFAPVVVGALWRGKLSPVHQAFVEEAQACARRLAS